jgi:hypothetical protein
MHAIVRRRTFTVEEEDDGGVLSVLNSKGSPTPTPSWAFIVADMAKPAGKVCGATSKACKVEPRFVLTTQRVHGFSSGYSHSGYSCSSAEEL